MKSSHVLAIIAAVLIVPFSRAQTPSIDSLKAKAETKKKETLVFKGFYLGMPIGDAQTLLNLHLGLPTTTSAPIVPPKATAQETEGQIFKAILGAALGQQEEEPNTPFKVFKDGETLRVQRAPDRLPFATANADGLVTSFEIAKPLRDKLFDAANIPAKEFLETFISAYNIPELEGSQTELSKVVFGTKIEVGFQRFYTHRSDLGYEFNYYMEPTILDDKNAALVDPYGADTIVLKAIKTAGARKSKFD